MQNLYPYTNFNDYNLDWIISKIKDLIKWAEATDEWKAKHEKEYKELKDLYDAVMSGNFPESIQNAFKKWMQENALDLVGQLVKMVFFGITDAGYFIAYIPEYWEDLKFGTTGLDDFPKCFDDYGHLTIAY